MQNIGRVHLVCAHAHQEKNKSLYGKLRLCTKCNKSQHFRTPGSYLEVIKLSDMENKIRKCLIEEVWQRYYELQ